MIYNKAKKKRKINRVGLRVKIFLKSFHDIDR